MRTLYCSQALRFTQGIITPITLFAFEALLHEALHRQGFEDERWTEEFAIVAMFTAGRLVRWNKAVTENGADKDTYWTGREALTAASGTATASAASSSTSSIRRATSRRGADAAAAPTRRPRPRERLAEMIWSWLRRSVGGRSTLEAQAGAGDEEWEGPPLRRQLLGERVELLPRRKRGNLTPLRLRVRHALRHVFGDRLRPHRVRQHLPQRLVRVPRRSFGEPLPPRRDRPRVQAVDANVAERVLAL
jgi:hypothetical protein